MMMLELLLVVVFLVALYAMILCVVLVLDHAIYGVRHRYAPHHELYRSLNIV